jgi:DNA-binding NarL/FixJ family response regulator
MNAAATMSTAEKRAWDPGPEAGSRSKNEDPARILVVDDDTEVRIAISEMLQRFGFAVVGQATNGLEAVEQAARLRPQVVLMDLRMPVMDGIQATEKIRLSNPEIPVVILSACDDRSLELAAANAGAFCYLLKGMRAGVILDVLRQAVAGDTSKLGHLGSFFLQRISQKEPSPAPHSPKPS